MHFKTTQVSIELRAAHPEVRAAANNLDAHLKHLGWGDLVVTDVIRTPDFYPDERWSWHFCGCAFDIRTKGYSTEMIERIIGWLEGWAHHSEFKVDVVNEQKAVRGPHIHVEVEDHEWRRKYELGVARGSV